MTVESDPVLSSATVSRTARNALAATGQVLASGVLFLVLYRYLLGSLGPTSLGIWSLVLASTNVSRLGGFGLQGSAVRYVARYIALGDRAAAASVMETAVLSTAAVIAAAALIAYPCVKAVLVRLLDPGAYAQAVAILPYAFGSLWLNAVGLVVQSGLDGCQRADLRSGTAVVGNALYVGAAIAAVPALGIVGLAMAQLAQSALITIFSWWRLRAALPGLPSVPRRWSRALFREMFGYGANVQAETVFWMLHDPLAKILLSHFGGLAAVGYFEMAARLVQQVRALLTAGFQVLVPLIADLHESDPGRLGRLYAAASQLLIFLAVPTFAALVVAAPLVGRLWIGHPQAEFAGFLALLSIGSAANVVVTPAMNANFGTGHIGWHTVAAALMAALNVALGIPAGYLFGGAGVVVAWVASMLAGSAVIGVSYHRRTGTAAAALFSAASVRLIAASVMATAAGGATALVLARTGPTGAGFAPWAAPAVFGLAMLAPMWLHPARARLLGALAAHWPRRGAVGA